MALQASTVVRTVRRVAFGSSRAGFITFIVAFGVIGSVFLLVSHAATPSTTVQVSLQPGNGVTLSGGAQNVSDPLALNQEAVEFGGEAGGTGDTSGGTTGTTTDPSGAAPPTTLSGYTLAYTQEFTDSSLLDDWETTGWGTYDGTPGGETASQGTWKASLCSISGGEAHFMSSGVAGCVISSYGTQLTHTYGAWFVRMKGDAGTPGHFSDIALLWPADDNWNAEVDFYEDMYPTTQTKDRSTYNASVCGSVPSPASNPGACDTSSYWTSQKGIKNDGSTWHTYGVEWTPSGTTFLDDGKVVAQSSKVPNVPMVLDLQSQDLDGTPNPANQETMTVDWIAEFSYNG